MRHCRCMLASRPDSSHAPGIACARERATPQTPSLRLRCGLVALCIGLLLALPACSSPSSSGSAMVGYKQNPNPRQAYRVVMTIADAPGPFAQMRALAHYDVVNRECLPPPKDNPGGHTAPVPTAPQEVPLERLADGTYTGVVHADRMLDEDYHGRGVCRWQLTGFVVQMKATGADGETLFVPSYSVEKLLAGEPETNYLSRLAYPRDEEIEDLPVFGRTDRASIHPAIRDEDLFTITFMASREAAP